MLACLSRSRPAGMACGEAFGALVIHDRTDGPNPAEIPRVLQLRETSLHLAYDAPDDDWLARGPRVGFQGLRVVWIWNKDGAQIDVGTLKLAGVSAEAQQDAMARYLAESMRREGKTVLVKTSGLAGKPCVHLQIDPPGSDDRQDMFLQGRGNIIYTLLVTAPARTAALLSEDPGRVGAALTAVLERLRGER